MAVIPGGTGSRYPVALPPVGPSPMPPETPPEFLTLPGEGIIPIIPGQQYDFGHEGLQPQYVTPFDPLELLTGISSADVLNRIRSGEPLERVLPSTITQAAFNQALGIGTGELANLGIRAAGRVLPPVARGIGRQLAPQFERVRPVVENIGAVMRGFSAEEAGNIRIPGTGKRLYYPTYEDFQAETERLGELPDQIAAIKEALKNEPAAPLTNIIGKSGKVETISVQTFRRIMGDVPKPSVITKGRVPWEYAFDQMAHKFGYQTDQELQTAIERANGLRQQVKGLDREILLGKAQVKASAWNDVQKLELQAQDLMDRGASPAEITKVSDKMQKAHDELLDKAAYEFRETPTGQMRPQEYAQPFKPPFQGPAPRITPSTPAQAMLGGGARPTFAPENAAPMAQGEMFKGQGPGGTLNLPGGEMVGNQPTLPLAQAAEQAPPIAPTELAPGAPGGISGGIPPEGPPGLGGAPPTEPPFAGGVNIPPPPPTETPIQKLTRLIKAAKPARGETEELKHKELQRRAAMFAQAIGKGQGYEAFARARGTLAGELPKAAFEAPDVGLHPEEWTSLYEQIRDWTVKNPRLEFRGLNTADALRKVQFGAIPTQGEIELLERMFGPEFAKAILSKRSLGTKAWETFVDLWNVPRMLMAGLFDMSYPLRQGIMLGPGHPQEYARMWPVMIKAWAKPEYAQAVFKDFTEGKYAMEIERAGLDIVPISDTAPFTLREEYFMSRLLQRVPIIGGGVQRAESSFVTAGNKLRGDIFRNILDDWQGMAHNTPVNQRALADFLNKATGRGSLGPLKDLGPILNGVFFAPKFTASRIQAPLSVLTTEGGWVVRRMIINDLLKFVGTGVTVLGLVKASGMGDVELDSRSGDFGKIRIGNTRFDFWGGEIQIARLVAQLITNQRKQSGTDKIVGLNRMETIARFVDTKLAPGAGAIVDVLRGQTYAGEELTLEGGSVANQIYQRLIPLFIQDIKQALAEDGIKGGLLAAAPAFFGAGVQSYHNIHDIQDLVAQGLYNGQFYNHLDQGQKRVVNDSAAVTKALEAVEGKSKVDVEQEARTAFRLFDQRKTQLEGELHKRIDGGLHGEGLRKAIQDFKKARWEASATVMTKEVVAEMMRGKEVKIEDALAELYYGIEIPENSQTGRLDFTQRDASRTLVLRKADELGVPRDYITGTGAGTFRGKRFQDDRVQAVVEQYEAAQETLQPWFRTYDTVLRALKLDPGANVPLPLQSKIGRLVGDMRKLEEVKHPQMLVELARWYPERMSKERIGLLLAYYGSLENMPVDIRENILEMMGMTSLKKAS